MNNRHIPTALKILRGNPGHKPLPENEPDPDIMIPEPPSYLSLIALEEWNRITPELELLGLISEIDRTALAAYCQCYSRHIQAEDDIAKNGMFQITAKGNKMQNPAVGISNVALQLMHKFLGEFGMSPSSRARVSGSKKTPPKGPGWGDI